MASNIDLDGGGPNDQQEEQALVAMGTGLETLDISSEEDSDDYSQTIDDIVHKVMTMNKISKPLPKLIGRLRQSLPPNTRTLAPGIRHLDDANHPSACQWEGATPHRSAAAGCVPTSAHMGYSSTKMVRSVSTPEMSDKYNYCSSTHSSEVDGRKPPASRKMDFTAQGLKGHTGLDARVEQNPHLEALADGPDMEADGIKPHKGDWNNKENIAPNFSSSWGAGSRGTSGCALAHQHTFRESTGTNRLFDRLALGFKTPGKPAELSDKIPFITGSCPKKTMPIISSSSTGRHHFTAGRQVIVSKHSNTLSRPSTTTTSVNSSTFSSMTALNMATTKSSRENVMASSFGLASARSQGSMLYSKHGSVHGALGPSSLPCLSEELFPSAALQGIQPIGEGPHKVSPSFNLYGRLCHDEQSNDKVVYNVTSGQGSQLSSDQKFKGSEPTYNKNIDHHVTLSRKVTSYAERPAVDSTEASTSFEDSTGLPTDPNLISALMKLNCSFDAGHTDTLTSYLAKQNISASSAAPVTTKQNVSPEISIVHSVTHTRALAASTISTSSQPQRPNNEQFLMPNPYTARGSVSNTNNTAPGQRTSYCNNRLDQQLPSQRNPLYDHDLTHPSSPSVKRQCLSNQSTYSHQSHTDYPSKASHPAALAGTALELSSHRSEQQGSTPMPRIVNCCAKATVTFAEESYREPRPFVDTNEPAHTSRTSEALLSTNTSEALRSNNTSEALRSSQTIKAHRSNNTSDTLRSSHSSETPHSSHTSEIPRSSHTSEAPRNSHTRGVPHSSHTSEAPRSSHTSETPRRSHTSEAPNSSHTSEAPHSSHTSEAPHSGHTSEAPHSSHTSETPRSSHTSETPRSSHTSEAPHSSHTSETPRSSHTSETPRSSHTSEAPHSSHTSETPRSSHTSGTVCPQRPADPVPSAAPSVPSMEPLFVNGKQYLKLSLLGKGGSSQVFEVLCMESNKVLAVKVVQLDGADDQMLAGYRNEMDILKQLQWSNRVIKLYDCEETASYLRLVMERGSKDLACVLKNARGKGCQPISPFTIQHYWQEMLLSVQAIHQQGIVHSDLKPANFILVGEILKLIDFGIASSIQNDKTSVLKDSQAGTFNYMSPESLNDVHSGPIMNGQAGDKPVIKIGTKSDVWSLGCILYNLVYSRTPFQHINNTWKKLTAISKADTVIEFLPCGNQHLLHTMQLCLQFHPKNRPTIAELLKHPYLTGVGLAEKSSVISS